MKSRKQMPLGNKTRTDSFFKIILAASICLVFLYFVWLEVDYPVPPEEELIGVVEQVNYVVVTRISNNYVEAKIKLSNNVILVQRFYSNPDIRSGMTVKVYRSFRKYSHMSFYRMS